MAAHCGAQFCDPGTDEEPRHGGGVSFACLQAWLGTRGSGPTVQAGAHVLGHSLAFSWQCLGTKGWRQLELTARSSLRVAPAQGLRSGRRGPSSREWGWEEDSLGCFDMQAPCAGHLGLGSVPRAEEAQPLQPGQEQSPLQDPWAPGRE